MSFFGQAPTEPNYVVIETDYESYSVVYSCNPLKQYLWFLTRDNLVSAELFSKMLGIAVTALPNFDFSKLATPDYQGDSCNYESPTLASLFLQ